MKIYLHEIKEMDTEVDFTQEEPWVVDAVRKCDEHLDGAPVRPGLKTRPIQGHLNLRKVDEVVVVSGEVSTQLELLCSRCGNPYAFDCSPRFNTLYCKDPEMAGIAHLAKNPDKPREPGRPAGQTKGFARHAHDESLDSEEGFGKDLDITYISEDFIDLGDLVSEQLQLQVPFQPLCKDDCKGICVRCGADQNVGRCACAKIEKESPFSVLKNFKV